VNIQEGEIMETHAGRQERIRSQVQLSPAEIFHIHLTIRWQN